MFLAKTGTVYTKTFNENRIPTFGSAWTITCKLVYGSGNDQGYTGAADHDIYRLYTRDMTLKVGDKIVVDSINYIVDALGRFDWVMKQYSMYLVKRTQWE